MKIENPSLTVQNHKYFGVAINTLASICIFIGFFTMLMWKIQRIEYLYFTVTTMFFNTALTFVVSGIALLFLGSRYTYVARFLGILVVIFATAVLSQDIFGIDLQIDNLFADFYYPIPETIPGRMAVQTSICFILSGISFIFLGDKSLSWFKILIGLLFAGSAASMAIVSTLGYFFHLPISSAWLLINPISINTAITFLFLTTGLILFAIWKSIDLRIPISDYVHYIIFLSITVGTLLLWQALLVQARITTDALIKNYGENCLLSFGDTLDSSVKRFDPILFRFFEGSLQLTDRNWKKYAESIFENMKYVDYVGYYSEELEPVLSYSHLDAPLPSHLINQNFSPDSIVVSYPFDLKKQSFYLIIYPILPEKKKGYFVRVIDIERLIKTTEHYKDDIFLTIYQGSKLFYHSPEAGPIDKDYLKEFQLDKYDKSWKMLIWPSPSFIAKNETHLPAITLVTGLLFALFMAYMFRISVLSYRRAQALVKAQANLLTAQEIANLGGWEWDLKKNEICLSEQACRMLGIGKTQTVLSEDDFFYLVHPKEAGKLKKAISTMRSGRSGYSEVYTFVRPDKEIRQMRFSAEVSAFHHHFPIEISGILQDVTKLKLLEEELQQSQKLDLIGQLTGGIAHDFNNILMVIQGNLELLSFLIDEKSKEYKKIETALAACTRGAALTKRLLAFARRETLDPEIIELKSYMENFAHLLGPTLGETIEISFEISPNPYQIYVDPNQLESALLNLVVNARDAMMGGGQLKIEVKNIDVSQGDFLKKEKIPYGSYLRISITDTGAGMLPEVLQHAEEPFFTTKPPNKGTGLCLSMVKGFAEQSNGYLRLSSKIGTGTTAELYFPMFIDETEKPSMGLESIDHRLLKGNQTILIAEDEEEVRSTSVEYLKTLGYEVLEAENGDIALDIFKKNQNIDLLFTDIVMPGTLRGPDLAEQVKKIKPNIKVLYTSGYPEKARGNGHILSPLIMKPYKLSDLALVLKSILKPSKTKK